MTTESQQYNNIENDKVSLRELIYKIQEWSGYLLSKWIIILVFGLLGGVLGFWYATTKKPVYTATTSFVLEDEKGGSFGGLAGLASMAGVDLGTSGGGVFQGENILGFYKSRTMIEKTLLTTVVTDKGKQLLIERYIDFNRLREKWAKQAKLANLKFTDNDSSRLNNSRLRDSILGVIVNDLNNNALTVNKPDKKLSTIVVDVKSQDETFAKTFNDALVKNVNEYYISTKTMKTLQNVKILQRKTDSVRAVMNGAIYTAVAVADATPNLNPTRQVQRLAPAQKAQFSAETNKSVLGSLVQNLELTKMTLLKEAPLIQVIDGPIYPLKVEKIGKLKGIVFGIFVFGILTVITIVLKKIIKDI